MAYLTVLGALAGAPTEIELATAPAIRGGQAVTASAGCLGCHKIGENGNTLGPNLTDIGSRLGRDAIARTLVNPTAPMPSFRALQEEKPEQFDKLVEYVASLKGEMSQRHARAPSPRRRCARCSTASPASTTA